MTAVIEIPSSLDEHSFEQVLEAVAKVPEDAKVLLDARHTKWASPYGLSALLTLGQARERARPTFAVPDDDRTRSYWSRSNFFYYAADLFDLKGVVPRKSPETDSNVLLPLTPVTKSEDVHEVVGHLQQKAQDILATELGIEPKALVGFAMTLSEICQNIVEHAGRVIGIGTYRPRFGRFEVAKAVEL